MKKIILLLLTTLTLPLASYGQRNNDRISLGVGALYQRGLDATLAFEHETKHHNMWEFFGNAYLKWYECETCNHVCPESFWKEYRTWEVGVAYKPCVARGKNHFGNLRLGVGGGSDTNHFMGGLHVGYEHNYALRKGWYMFWQARTELMLKGRDLFRTGIAIGFKIPTN